MSGIMDSTEEALITKKEGPFQTKETSVNKREDDGSMKKRPKSFNMSFMKASVCDKDDPFDVRLRKTHSLCGDCKNCERCIPTALSQETNFCEDDCNKKGRLHQVHSDDHGNVNDVRPCKKIPNYKPSDQVLDTKGGRQYSYFTPQPLGAHQIPSRTRASSLTSDAASNNSIDSSRSMTSCSGSSGSGCIVELCEAVMRGFEQQPQAGDSSTTDSTVFEESTEPNSCSRENDPLLSNHFTCVTKDVNNSGDVYSCKTSPLIAKGHAKAYVYAQDHPSKEQGIFATVREHKTETSAECDHAEPPVDEASKPTKTILTFDTEINIDRNDVCTAKLMQPPEKLSENLLHVPVSGSTQATTFGIDTNSSLCVNNKQDPKASSQAVVPPSLPCETRKHEPFTVRTKEANKPISSPHDLQSVLGYQTPSSCLAPTLPSGVTSSAVPVLQVLVPVPKRNISNKNLEASSKNDGHVPKQSSMTSNVLKSSNNYCDTNVYIGPVQPPQLPVVTLQQKSNPPPIQAASSAAYSLFNDTGNTFCEGHSTQYSLNAKSSSDFSHTHATHLTQTQPHALNTRHYSSIPSQHGAISPHAPTDSVSDSKTNAQIFNPGSDQASPANKNHPSHRVTSHGLVSSDMTSQKQFQQNMVSSQDNNNLHESSSLSHEFSVPQPWLSAMPNRYFMIPPDLQPNSSTGHLYIPPMTQNNYEDPIPIQNEANQCYAGQQQFFKVLQPFGFPPCYPYYTNNFAAPWFQPMFYGRLPSQTETVQGQQNMQHPTIPHPNRTGVAPFTPPPQVTNTSPSAVPPALESLPADLESSSSILPPSNNLQNQGILSSDSDIQTNSGPNSTVGVSEECCYNAVSSQMDHSLKLEGPIQARVSPTAVSTNVKNRSSSEDSDSNWQILEDHGRHNIMMLEDLNHQPVKVGSIQVVDCPDLRNTKDVGVNGDNNSLELFQNSSCQNCSGHRKNIVYENGNRQDIEERIEGFSHTSGQVPVLARVEGIKRSLSSSTDSSHTKTESHTGHQSTQSQLNLLTDHCGYTMSDPPNYSTLCRIACFINIVFGALAMWLNHLAVKDFKRHRFASSSRKHLGAILLSTSGIFITLTVLLLLSPSLLSVLKVKPVGGYSYNATEHCLTMLVGTDETFLKIYDMELETYCEMLKNRKLKNSLVAHAIHYNSMKKELAECKRSKMSSISSATLPEKPSKKPKASDSQSTVSTQTDKAASKVSDIFSDKNVSNESAVFPENVTDVHRFQDDGNSTRPAVELPAPFQASHPAQVIGDQAAQTNQSRSLTSTNTSNERATGSSNTTTHGDYISGYNKEETGYNQTLVNDDDLG